MCLFVCLGVGVWGVVFWSEGYTVEVTECYSSRLMNIDNQKTDSPFPPTKVLNLQDFHFHYVCEPDFSLKDQFGFRIKMLLV